MLNSNLLAVVVIIVVGVCKGQGISKDLYRCRQICYTKFIPNWHQCMDYQDCRNCWKSCDETFGPFPLTITSASKQGSMVLTDISWDPTITNTSKQCLVTWEVSGGGLMGNLLTDGSTVELSLWADTVYHIQVTCKRKENERTRKSLKLIVDTRKLSIGSSSTSTFIPSSSTISTQNTHQKKFENLFLPDQSVRNAKDFEQIFRDSSKDKTDTFVTADNEESMNHISSVMLSKLEIKKRSFSDKYSTNLLYVLFASLSLGLMFLLLVVILVFSRICRSNPSVDKEELVNSELYQDERILHV